MSDIVLATQKITKRFAGVGDPAPDLGRVRSRQVHASRTAWAGICWADRKVLSTDVMVDLEVLDRVGGGDSFASGLIYGLLNGMPVDEALRCP